MTDYRDCNAIYRLNMSEGYYAIESLVQSGLVYVVAPGEIAVLRGTQAVRAKFSEIDKLCKRFKSKAVRDEIKAVYEDTKYIKDDYS